jgi:3-deoxy-7-phosphoheptulonate synthase
MEDIKGLKLSKKDESGGEEKHTFSVGNVEIGKDFVMIAGPCSIENRTQTLETSRILKELGVDILRGGAFKARTSPYDFQGLGEEGLRIIKDVKEELGLPVISEVLDTRDVGLVSEYVDILQIGSRNMQNFSLLKEVGRSEKPVMLKRGMSSTLEEWLNCAEYILSEGNQNVILCERGIRTFEKFTRNTVDISAVPAIKNISNLPVFVDPSHGTGRVDLIEPVSLASVAAGADGLMIEVHYKPEEAVSDRLQAMHPEKYSILINKVRKLSKALAEINSVDE